MSSINISSLTQRLTKRLESSGQRYLENKVNTLVNGAQGITNLANKWVQEFKKILSRPAASRGYYKNRLKPNTSANPMMVTGKLRDALYVRVASKITSGKANVSINYGFLKLPNKKLLGYSDYGEYLNAEHPSIQGFKERAYERLNNAIAAKLSNRGYK
jgi:hypothetical protein